MQNPGDIVRQNLINRKNILNMMIDQRVNKVLSFNIDKSETEPIKFETTLRTSFE